MEFIVIVFIISTFLFKVAYVGRNFGVFTDIENPFEPEFTPKPNEEKGGMMMTANVNYNCLRGQADEGNALDVVDWKCSFCQVYTFDKFFKTHIRKLFPKFT